MKLFNSILLMSIAFSLNVFSQSQASIVQLMKGDSPEDYTIFKETPRPNNDIHVSGVKVPAMELYIPEGGKKNMACVLICPGGGYRILSFIKEGRLLAAEFNKIGIAAAVLRYRLPAETEVKSEPWMPLVDAQLGLQYLNQNAGSLGLNKQKIGIMGFSAGGHLAASASTLFRFPQQNGMIINEIRPDFSILVYPVITMNNDFTHQGSKNNLLGANPLEKDVKLFTLEKQVTKNTPPTFLIHAKDDTVVPIENSRRYRDACVENNVNAVLYELNAGGHGFGLGRPESGKWFQFLSEWLLRTL